MFYGYSKLKSIDFGDIDTTAAVNLRGMFDGCKSLTSLDLSRFNTTYVKGGYDFTFMFSECSSLTKVVLGSSFVVAKGADTTKMFINCSALTTIIVPNETVSWTQAKGTNMFYGCTALLNKFGQGAVDQTRAFVGTNDQGINGFFVTSEANANNLLNNQNKKNSGNVDKPKVITPPEPDSPKDEPVIDPESVIDPQTDDEPLEDDNVVDSADDNSFNGACLQDNILPEEEN